MDDQDSIYKKTDGDALNNKNMQFKWKQKQEKKRQMERKYNFFIRSLL